LTPGGMEQLAMRKGFGELSMESAVTNV
jgi:hypothetical protein